ncbi:ABC transporter ATP-binding protein [Sporosarcina sp. FSL K6-1508]|uniref:ABC transporter ATP-binding protein n=1 Tax=Sporosarcina sp. FSL K6-1508 TaxID=2921553 RepID=UPI0030F5D00A
MPLLLEVKELEKVFIKKTGSMFKRKKTDVYAVNNISFSIRKGEILGIIGESGCGKTTTIRMIMRLMKESNGDIIFNGKNLCASSDSEITKIRKDMQMIFQDPYDTLNPGMRIVDILMEPLNVHESSLSREGKYKKVKEITEAIELIPAEDYLQRYPHQLSGGQRQRIAIARSVILRPSFIAADEPTSMLDVSVRAGILNLLLDLRDKFGLTMLLITHDLSTASYMCNRIAVMYQGSIVEIGSTQQIINSPKHPYTKALVSVVKDLNHFIKNREKMILDGEVDSTKRASGCIFVSRCPNQEHICHSKLPIMETLSENHSVACHFHQSFHENLSQEMEHLST